MLSRRLFDDDFFAPFQRMERLFQNLDRLTTGPGRARGLGFPDVHVLRRDQEVLVRAEVPGLTEDDLEVEVLGRTLSLKGERVHEVAEGEHRLHRERPVGEFFRTLELPFRVDPESVEARLAHGVLEIRMRRPEADQPRRIPIRVG
jgi:HSP20 family protein